MTQERDVMLRRLTRQLEEQILRVLDTLETTPGVDKRWLHIGRTAIESGFMSVDRSIENPERIKLPGDSAQHAG